MVVFLLDTKTIGKARCKRADSTMTVLSEQQISDALQRLLPEATTAYLGSPPELVKKKNRTILQVY
jgi:hypothetical protein